MDEQGCPRCKTTKYRNPSLKLLVNVCGHSLCENCVDLLFIKGSGECPECGTALRRSNFRLQLFEDPAVEKELDIRRKILKDFNKKEDDFPSLLEYNNYLEMIETLIFNLNNGIDVDEAKKMIDQYKKDNKEQIKKNLFKMSKDQEYLDLLIEEEKHHSEQYKHEQEQVDARQKALKKKNKAALIDELMFSDMAAKDILASHRDNTVQMEVSTRSATHSTYSTGIKIGYGDSVMPLPAKEVVEEEFVYVPYDLKNTGPRLMDQEEVQQHGYLTNVRKSSDAERSGGFQAVIACQRALHDAVCGLFYFAEDTNAGPSHPMVT